MEIYLSELIERKQVVLAYAVSSPCNPHQRGSGLKPKWVVFSTKSTHLMMSLEKSKNWYLKMSF